MAKFIGTVQEFHHFIGPKIRNSVNLAARNHRNRVGGLCQECGQKAELQSAHVHGRGRRTLIEAILALYTDVVGIVACDLDEIEQLIIKSHLPIEDTFRFLCHACHVAYDSGARGSRLAHREVRADIPSVDSPFRKLTRIRLWASRPQQVNHQMIKAFLLLEQGGRLPLAEFKRYCTEALGIAGFDGNYASMKTDAGNAHGKVFFDDGSTVQMWPDARNEVETHFRT